MATLKGNNTSTTTQSGSSRSGSAIGGQVVGVVSGPGTSNSVTKTNTSSNQTLRSNPARVSLKSGSSGSSVSVPKPPTSATTSATRGVTRATRPGSVSTRNTEVPGSVRPAGTPRASARGLVRGILRRSVFARGGPRGNFGGWSAGRTRQMSRKTTRK